jgi:Flp pilus assembly protein TadG
MVEMALVLPILLFVIIGVVEIGHAVNAWNDETNIAQVVARDAVVGKQPSSAACGEQPAAAFVQCEAEHDGIPNPKAMTVCINAPVAKPGEPVEVKVESKYKWLSYLRFKFTESTLSGRATMRLEQTPPEVKSC